MLKTFNPDASFKLERTELKEEEQAIKVLELLMSEFSSSDGFSFSDAQDAFNKYGEGGPISAEVMKYLVDNGALIREDGLYVIDHNSDLVSELSMG